MRVYAASESEIQKLATKTGSHAGLVIKENGHGVLLESSQATDAAALPFDEFAGIRMLMHATASGKEILAHRDGEKMASIIEQHGLTESTSETTTDRAALEEELESVCEQGFAISREESIKGLFSIAAPIIDMNDEIYGAVTVYGATGKQRDQFIDETSQYVIQTSKVCEMNLNHTP